MNEKKKNGSVGGERAVVAAEQVEVPAPVGMEADYVACLPEAMALAEGEFGTFTGHAVVVLQNARRGVDAVLDAQSALAAPDAPKVDVERVRETMRAAKALVYAANVAANATAARSETMSRMRRMYELRDELITNALGLVKSRVLTDRDADEVAQIQQGSGAIDAAQDCIALAALYRRRAAQLKGRTPVSQATVQEAATLGSSLLDVLKPLGAASTTTDETITRAAEVRDRLAALLARRYAYVARIGGWLWGHELAEHVPPLRSRSVSAAAGEQTEPQPVPQPAPQPA